MDRVPVSEAAARLGVTPDAVRQRIRRGTIQYEKTDEGRYYVFLAPHDGRRDGVQKALVERLHDENEWLRREVERKDTIIMSLSQSIAALEAPPAPRDGPETGPDPKPGVDPRGDGAGPEAAVSRRSSWWRRLFGA